MIVSGKVSVIVLNFNGLANNYLVNCLDSLVMQTYKLMEIVVVDNGSSDNSAKFIYEQYPQVKVVLNEKNEGFCRGNNIGIGHISGVYVCFANNDTIFKPTTIEKMVSAINLSKNIGMISPKIVRPKEFGNNVIDSAGLMLRKDLTLRDRGFGELDDGRFDHPCYVFGPCGAAAFYRYTTLVDVAYNNNEVWDESFFAYYEDGDLAWRAQSKGWLCYYEPSAVVVHNRGGTSNAHFFSKPTKFKIHTIKNRYLMILKNITWRYLLQSLTHLCIREILIWMYFIIHPALLIDVFHALFHTVPQSLSRRSIKFWSNKSFVLFSSSDNETIRLR